MCFIVDIVKFFDSESLVASVDIIFLIKKQCGVVSTKKARCGHSTRYLYTLLETISTRFYWLTAETKNLSEISHNSKGYLIWY